MTALVTGAGGFLGLEIVKLLRARGDAVRGFSRSHHPALDALGVEQVRGDLSDASAVTAAVRGYDVVFHVAAKAGVWGPWRDYFNANVIGTRNVLAACRAAKVRRLVYTSSPSVVFSGTDLEGVDESVPYATHFLTAYPHTKRIAEEEVLRANGPDLATVALRPHLIWGPGDAHLTPRLVARAKVGQLRRIGSGANRVDSIYVTNAADAHVLAGDKLAPGSPIAGKAYFLSNGEPLPVWDLVNRILAAAGVPPVTKTISTGAAYAAAWVAEWLHRLTFRPGEPRLTRFVAAELTKAHWFDISAARRDLGYEPKVSIADGLTRLAEWYRANGRSTEQE